MQKIIGYIIERIKAVSQNTQSFIKSQGGRLGTISVRAISMSVIAFMMGRVSLLGGLSPFGLAFFASSYGQGISPLVLGIAVILGVVSWSWNIAIITKVAFSLILFFLFTKLAKWCKAEGSIADLATLFASSFIVNVFPSLFNFYLFEFVLAFFESIVTVMIFILLRKGTAILLSENLKNAFNSEEIISLGFIGALTIAGIRDISVPFLFNIEIRTIVCVLIVMLFAKTRGASVGTATGITMGLVSCITGLANFSLLGAYAFCGFMSGMFRKLGNLGVILGFITANAVFSYYLSGSTEILIHLRDILIASGLIYLIPERYVERASRIFDAPSLLSDYNSDSDATTSATVKKLTAFSKAVEDLAESIVSIPSPVSVPGEIEASSFFDSVADRVCKSCSLSLYCWERKFHSTYKSMFSILELLEAKGKLSDSDVAACFQGDSCAKPDELVSIVNNLYEVYRINHLWKKKVEESRALVSQQLQGVSQIISSLANEVSTEISNQKSLEYKLLKTLENQNIRPSELTLRQGEATTEIGLMLNTCAGISSCKKNIPMLFSSILGKRVVAKGLVCKQGKGMSQCKLVYTSSELYGVTVGVSKANKLKNAVSGDSFTFMELKDKKYVLGLSDGMGSGKAAARNSQTAVDLLEKFLESGFDKEIAIKIINSALVLKSAEESYATMDISAIDLYSGKVEFVKIGSPPSYIKRNDHVEIIKSTSLPAGVIEKLDLDLCHAKLNSGDYVVMVTDGATDSNWKEDSSRDWLVDCLEEFDSPTPQEMADTIIQRAITNYAGIVDDDVTVLVAKLWDKAS